MAYPSPPKNNPVWLQKLFLRSQVTTLFSEHLELPLFFVPVNDWYTWYTVVNIETRLRPGNFELFYGKKEERHRYNEICLAKAAKTGKPVLGRHAGLADLFVPVMDQKQCRGVLVAGSFSLALPDKAGFKTLWKKISGSDQLDEDALGYCRALIETSLLDADSLRDVTKLLTAVANLERNSKISAKEKKRLTSLLEVNQRLPQRMWRYVGIKRHRLFWGTYQGVDLAPWDQKEWGIHRVPDTVLAVAPRFGDRQSLDQLLSAARIQRECFEWVKSLPQTLSGPMGRQGIYLLTSVAGRGALQKKLALADLARKVILHLGSKHGEKASVGIGSISENGRDLPESFRQAGVALQLALHQACDILHFEDVSHDAELDRRQPSEIANDLVRTLSTGMADEMEPLREEFVTEALFDSGDDTRVLKVHVSNLLLALLKAAGDRSLQGLRDQVVWRKRLLEDLRHAQTGFELMRLLDSWIESCLGLMKNPVNGRQNLILVELARYLKDNIHMRISLGKAAKQAGYSATHFARVFKKRFGRSYVTWMRQVRISEAARQLLHTKMTVGQVAAACGFSSLSYFVRDFEKGMGLSPLRYRTGSSSKANSGLKSKSKRLKK